MLRFISYYLVLIIILLVLATFGSMVIGGYRINFTNSYPMGVYKIIDEQFTYGDYVLACPVPSVTTSYARSQGYLSYGTCPGMYGTLLKQVMAIPGDRVQRNENKLITVNGNAVDNSQHIQYDNHGFAMPLPQTGIVENGMFWLLSNYHPHSLDSRYFGAFPRKNIISKVVPVWLAH